MEVWKIVRRLEDGRLASAAEICQPAYYSTDERTLPTLEGSYLYAFTSLADARNYLEKCWLSNVTLEIWTADAGTVRMKPFCSYWLADNPKLWNGTLYKHFKVAAPEGSVYCKWIQLKEFVEARTIPLRLE